MRSILPLVILPALLTGCAAPAGNCDALPLPRYQDAEERMLADELDAAGRGAIWPGRMVDYYQMRESVKACKGNGYGP
jgi:hypothetical protein